MSEPIHVISLGAGVQSSTMALMAAHGEITPTPKCAIFADTQDEPQSVYKWLDWLEKQLPFPVHRVTAGKLSADALHVHVRKDGAGFWTKNLIPAFVKNLNGSRGITQRQCTYEYKVQVILKNVRKLAEIKRGQTSIGVVQWIGISLNEVHRMKPSRVQWSEHKWPLIEKRISRHDCLRWMTENGYPEPPRSACAYCPYHSDTEWRRLKDHEPESFAMAVQFERDYQGARAKAERAGGIPFLHNSLIPLDQVDFSTDEDHGQQVMFGNECEGMCGV